MTTTNHQDQILDPVEILNENLEHIWHTLCCTYDASEKVPDVITLFFSANLSKPIEASKIVLRNMLLEVMENVGRFSPWYTRPARAFGLTSWRDPISGQSQWILAPEAVQKWQETLEELAVAIDQNYSLIQAMILVEGLMEKSSQKDPLVIAHCKCTPPRTIQITRSVLEKAEILCDACMQPFI